MARNNPDEFFTKKEFTPPKPAHIILSAALVAVLSTGGWLLYSQNTKGESATVTREATPVEIWHAGMTPRISALISALETLPEVEIERDRVETCKQIEAMVGEITTAQETGPAPEAALDTHLQLWAKAANDLAQACPTGDALKLANDSVYRQFGPFLNTLSLLMPLPEGGVPSPGSQQPTPPPVEE